MKKTLIFLLCICVFIGTCSFSTSAATNTYDITELEGKYKTQGRTEVVDGTLFLDWSASGMEFNANCSGDVSIKVNTTRIKSGETGGIYFTVIVDGVVQYENQRIPSNNNADSWTSNSTNYPFKIQNEGISEFTIAKNLAPGSHTFEIYNQTEALNGAFGIQSITLNGELLAPKANNELYIEFVGDSITAGLGNLSVGGQGAPLYQDATRGWAYLTAKKLNADWSLIAQSGITASNGIGWQGSSSVSMQTVYPKFRYYSDNNKNYNFNRSADVVVICLGTNDLWTYQTSGKTLDYLKSEFKNMLNLVRNHNPNAKIVWIHGMMINDADSLIKNAIEELGGSDKELYTLSLPKNVAGGQGHPNLETQTTYADTVSNFINRLFNNDNDEDNTQSKPEDSTSSSTSSNEDNKPQSKPENSTSSSTNSSEDDKQNYNSSTNFIEDNNSQEQTDNTSDSVTESEDDSSNEDSVSNNQGAQNKPNKNTANNKADSGMKLSYIIPIVLLIIGIAFAGVIIFLFIKLKRNKIM